MQNFTRPHVDLVGVYVACLLLLAGCSAIVNGGAISPTEQTDVTSRNEIKDTSVRHLNEDGSVRLNEDGYICDLRLGRMDVLLRKSAICLFGQLLVEARKKAPDGHKIQMCVRLRDQLPIKNPNATTFDSDRLIAIFTNTCDPMNAGPYSFDESRQGLSDAIDEIACAEGWSVRTLSTSNSLSIEIGAPELINDMFTKRRTFEVPAYARSIIVQLNLPHQLPSGHADVRAYNSTNGLLVSIDDCFSRWPDICEALMSLLKPESVPK